MWAHNEILKEDLEELVHCDFIEWEKFKDKTFFITGATGVIGFNLISGLVYASIKRNLNLRIVALVRNYDKAISKHAKNIREKVSLKFIVGDVVNLPEIYEDVNYIIHTASPTSSNYFVENPVETIKTSVIGTINILELAKNKKVEGFIYTSSMEVYGVLQKEKELQEEDLGYMDPLLVRNCYPESKRQCEALCAAYASEYNVPAVSVRLAQTFGIGVDKNDRRVFAEFARCIIDKKDIVLWTDGGSKRCYLYTNDAVSAILTVLTKGENGKSYNVGNKATYCSVREMAQMVIDTFGQKNMKVRLGEDCMESRRFSPVHYYNLKTRKIEELGWRPKRDLIEMYKVLINELKKDE